MGLPKIGSLLFALVLTLSISSVARADAVSFQNVVAIQGNTRVDLSSNPNVSLIGPEVNFLVDIAGATPDAGINSLRVTFLEAGHPGTAETFRVPLFDGLPSDYSQLFKYSANSPTFQGAPVVLTVELLDGLSGSVLQSAEYNFLVVQPVPEPATISLLTLGMFGLYRRGKRKGADLVD